MFLKNITVHKYRSIQHARADFENGLNIVIGKNGVGKSNLLKYIDENVDYYAIFSDTEHGRAMPVEFEYTVCYSDHENSQNEITINFRRERIIRKNGLGVSGNIKVTKKKNGSIIYQDKPYGTTSDLFNTVALPHSNEDEHGVFDIILEMQKHYVAFEIPSEPIWLARSMKYELNPKYGLDFDFDEFMYKGFSLLLRLNGSLYNTFLIKRNDSEGQILSKTLTGNIFKIFLIKLSKD